MKYNNYQNLNKSKGNIKRISLLRTNIGIPHTTKMKNQSNEIIKKINFQKNIGDKKNIGCQTFCSLSYNKKAINSRNNNNKLYKIRSVGNDSWASLLLRSNENLKRKSPNSKTFQSNFFPYNNIHSIIIDKRILKKTAFSNYNSNNNKTTLSGGDKKNKNDIKDNMNARVKKSQAYLYKMLNEYDLCVDYNKPNPFLKGLNINLFQTNKRYYGYQKGVVNHHIFRLNIKDEIMTPHKRLYRNKSDFKSQIKLKLI